MIYQKELILSIWNLTQSRPVEIGNIRQLALLKMLLSILNPIFQKVQRKIFSLAEDFLLSNLINFRMYIKAKVIRISRNKLISLKRVGGLLQDIKSFQDFMFTPLMASKLMFKIKYNLPDCKIFMLLNMKIRCFLI